MSDKETLLKFIDSDEGIAKACEAIRIADRQSLASSKEQTLTPFLQKMQEKIQRRTIQISQKWSDWGDDGPIAFPENCKLFYKKGKSVAIIVQELPKVRSVVFDSKLISKESSENRVFNFNLAFPYMNFLFAFRDGKLKQGGVSLFYLREPFTNVDQKPLNPNLSNLDENLKLCMGQSMPEMNDIVGNYSAQVSRALDHYWSSKWTNEWSNHYWNSQSIDAKIATPRKWEESSRVNPAFPLDIPWKESIYPSIRNIISSVWDGDPIVAEINKEIFTQIVDETIKELQDTLLEIPAAAENTLASVKTSLKNVLIQQIQNSQEA